VKHVTLQLRFNLSYLHSYINPLTPTVAIWVQRQSAQMTKITNDGLTRSCTGYFIAVPIRQQWASKG